MIYPQKQAVSCDAAYRNFISAPCVLAFATITIAVSGQQARYTAHSNRKDATGRMYTFFVLIGNTIRAWEVSTCTDKLAASICAAETRIALRWLKRARRFIAGRLLLSFLPLLPCCHCCHRNRMKIPRAVERF